MKHILLTLLSIILTLSATAQRITPEAKARASELVSRMTLEEKLSYIGGYDGFYIRSIPHG